MTRLDQLFEQWALQTPAQQALIGVERPPLNFAQLGKKLLTLRMAIRHLGLDRTSRLALLVPNGPDLALAFLVGVTSVICAPLNPAYRKEELAFYLEDLDVSALLIAGALESPAREVAHSRGIPILELHELLDQPAGCFAIEGTTGLTPVAERATQPDDIALILHTSGTTARPKQVPLTQANLCASIHHLQHSLALTPQDRCLNLMPLFHIHGLVGALLAALGSGGSVVCPPDFATVKILAWLQTYQPTWYTAVPTLHQAILAQARHEPTSPARGVLRLIRSSSASLPPTVMAELEEVFGVPVIEAYGMTEAAHQMASNPLPPGVRKPGSVGLPAGPEIRILSASGAGLPVGEVGEVAIQGPNVMAGYCQNPEANAQAFSQGWFRTGDQGYLDSDGYLFLTGRLKELINRGGEKISPLEIDQALLRHPAVQQAVTFALPHPTLGEEVAAAVVLMEQTTVTEAQLQNFLAESLAEFKIPRRIAIVSDIPKGPTGKIQRIGLGEKFFASLPDPKKKTGETPPRTNLEQQISFLWSSILGQEDIALHDSFLQLGGDSISGAQLLSRIRDLFQVDVSWLQLFQEANSVAGMAKFIQDHHPENGLSTFPPLVRSPDHTQLPLAFVQEPLWLATQLDPANTAYNRSLILSLKGPFNRQALEGSLNDIVRRHEALRTTFLLGPNGPSQLLSPEVTHTLKYCDLSHTPTTEMEEAFKRFVTREVGTPFDLRQGPVFQATLYRVSESEHRLVVVLHHLVSDGWSDGVFYQELETLYNDFSRGEPSSLAELSIQYGDFVLWQRQWLTEKTLESQLAYWKEQLGGLHSFQIFQGTRTPLSRTRQSGQRERVLLPPSQTEGIKSFSRQEGITSFTVLLSGFFILLHHWTQKDDLICGVPLANRIHPSLEPLIGFFVNVLPFRSTNQQEHTFRSYIQSLHKLSLSAFSHADVPFQELRQLLGHTEDLTRNSLFQILFVFENAPQYFPKLTDVQCAPLTLPYGEPALVDLSLFLWDHPLGFQGHMAFDEEIFEASVIRHLISNYYVILEEVTKNPDASLDSLQLDLPLIDHIFPEKRSQYERSQEDDLEYVAETIEAKSVLSAKEIDSSAIRRERLQKRGERLQEQVAKLSQSQKEALNEKLKKILNPPKT
jgi:acyl-CoA synthetase (AMP-forming)/AMP-acid ligase II